MCISITLLGILLSLIRHFAIIVFSKHQSRDAFLHFNVLKSKKLFFREKRHCMHNNIKSFIDKHTFLTTIFLIILCINCYLFINHITMQYVIPHYFQLTFVDKKIPFIPATIWIYLSCVMLFIASGALLSKNENKLIFIYGVLLYTIISYMFFLLFPICYPRGNYPLPNDVNSITNVLFSWLRSVDSPATCFPSSHVGYCYLASFVHLNEHKTKFIVFFSWATLIVISTLTTKQHYLWDVIAATVISYSLFRLAEYWLHKSNNNKENDDELEIPNIAQ